MNHNYIVAVGMVCMDEYYRLPHWIGEGDKVSGQHLFSIPGGMVPNAAAILAGYGAKTYFLDVVNHSDCSNTLLSDLQTHSVDLSHILYDDTLPDTRCFIYLSGDERTVIAVNGRRPNFPLEDKHYSLLQHAGCIYSTPYNLILLPDCIQHLAVMKQSGGLLALDIEGHDFTDEETALMNMADILFFNQYGFQNFCKGHTEETCIKKLLDSGVQFLIVTLGAEGCVLYHGKKRLQIPGIPVTPTDPTGAGDTFNSSFLFCLLSGQAPENCLHFANAAAARSVTLTGPRSGAVPENTVRDFMRESGAKKDD